VSGGGVGGCEVRGEGVRGGGVRGQGVCGQWQLVWQFLTDTIGYQRSFLEGERTGRGH